MATVIGTVSKVEGMAIVVDDKGNRHMLKAGEVLHAGDKVITASGATVVVKLANGETVNFAEAQTVKITENLAQADVSDVTENAVNQAIFDAVLTALNEGRDVTDVLDDPAAGGLSSDGNSTFVNLERIQTADANANNFNGGSGLGTNATLGGIAPNYVYFAEATDSPTVTLVDDQAPEGFLNANEVVNGLTTARIGLPIGVEPGDVVNITHNTGAIAVTLTAANIAVGFVNVDIPVPASLEGTTLVVTASVTNQSGQVSPSASDSAFVDTTPPDLTKISGQLPETLVDDTGASQTDNITNNRTPTLTGTTESVTDKVEVTVNGTTYTATVSAGPNGTAVWTVPLTGAALTSGTYTPKITVTDVAGNVSTKDSETFTVDIKAPEVTITLDSNVAGDGVVNLVESQSAGIPVTGKVTGEFKAGDVVTITVNNKDFTGTVTAGGTFTINVPGADLAADPDRTIDARVTVTDTAGNSTTATDTQTYSVDTTPPDLTKISGQLPETLVDDTGASQTDNITKNPAPTLIGTTENVTDKVVITVNGKDYTATVSAGPNGTAVWTVPLTGAGLTSGTYTPQITVTDLAGNQSTKGSETFTVDVTAPIVTITLDSNVAGDGVVNLVESQSAGIPVTGKVTGEFKAGDVVTITVNNNDFTGTVTAAGTFSINVPGADLAADANRTIDARITVTDTAGNSSTATDSQTYGVDVDPPALAISLDANVAGDGIVNVAESTAAAIPVTGTVSGQFKVGDIVTLSINNKTFTGAVLAGGKFSIDVPGADLASDADRTIEASVTTTDVAGNSTTAIDTQTYTVNLLPPALAISLDANVAGDGIVNVAESTAAAIPVTGTVSGQFKAGDIVTVTVNGKDFTGAVATDGTFSINVPGADLAKDPDATVFASVTTTNAAGNSATATDTQTYTVNLLPPALAISLDANVAGDGIVNVAESTAASIPVTGTVSGQFKVGDVVTLTINNKPFTGTVLDGGKFSINVPGADLAADSDATIFASVTTTNAAGNSATATDTQTYTVNTAPPAVAISLDANVAGDGIVNVAESTAAAIPVTGTVSGQFKAGDIVTVTVNGKDFTGAVATDGTFSINVPGADLAKDPDATVFASVTTTNAAGNSATATDTQTYTVNLLPPALAISLDANVAGDGIVNVAESTAASIPVTGTVSGQFKVGDVVTLTINNKPFTGTVLDGGKFSINVPGADLAADSDSTIFASVTTTNAAGNSATATDTQDYKLAINPNLFATIALDANFAGDGIINIEEAKATTTIAVTGTVGGDAEVGDPVLVTINGKDYATTVVTRADGKLGFSVNVAGNELAADPDKTIDAKVTVSDNAGNSLSQSTQLTYTVDLTPPKAEIALDANFGGDGIINIEEAKATSTTPVTGTVGGDA
ncbi:beta strand repeat-containing protein, partial [Methylophilus aquaticus]